MPWATAISVGGSLLGGALGGSDKGAERAARDATAMANYQQETASLTAKEGLQPFVNTGTAANQLLADYLGIDYSGYKAKPVLQDFIDQRRDQHFKKYGTDYGRNSNVAGERVLAKNRYNAALKQWEKGLDQYKQDNQGNSGSGRLLREFTGEDLQNEPGYQFGMQQGEQGINRAFAARGGYDSGAALKSLNRFSQDYAGTKFGDAFNRDAANKQSIYQMLSGQSGQGMNAATTQGNIGINAATQMGQNSMNQANNSWQAANANNENTANAIQSGLGNLVYGIRRGNQSVVSSPTPQYGKTNAVNNAYYA